MFRILSVGQLRQEDRGMFEVSLDCRVNSRSVWALDEALSKKETEAPKKRTEYIVGHEQR